jgi:hypothetical protein
MVNSWEHGNEISFSMKGANFLDQPSECWLLKKDSYSMQMDVSSSPVTLNLITKIWHILWATSSVTAYTKAYKYTSKPSERSKILVSQWPCNWTERTFINVCACNVNLMYYHIHATKTHFVYLMWRLYGAHYPLHKPVLQVMQYYPQGRIQMS